MGRTVRLKGERRHVTQGDKKYFNRFSVSHRSEMYFGQGWAVSIKICIRSELLNCITAG